MKINSVNVRVGLFKIPYAHFGNGGNIKIQFLTIVVSTLMFAKQGKKLISGFMTFIIKVTRRDLKLKFWSFSMNIY